VQHVAARPAAQFAGSRWHLAACASNDNSSGIVAAYSRQLLNAFQGINLHAGAKRTEPQSRTYNE